MRKILKMIDIPELKEEFWELYSEQVYTSLQDFVRNLIELEYIIDQVSFDLVTKLNSDLEHSSKHMLNGVNEAHLNHLEKLMNIYLKLNEVTENIDTEMDDILMLSEKTEGSA